MLIELLTSQDYTTLNEEARKREEKDRIMIGTRMRGTHLYNIDTITDMRRNA